MTKRIQGAAAVLLAVAVICQVMAQEQPKPAVPRPGKTAASPAPPQATSPARKPAAPDTVAPAAPVLSATDNEALQKLTAGLAAAFSQHGAREFAAHFTDAGEYLDEAGTVFHGRPAIAADFDGVFSASPEVAIELSITSARLIAPGLAAVDGASLFRSAPAAAPVAGTFSFIGVRLENRWQIASFREVAESEPATHHAQVQQLEWLLGDWIDEAADAHVHFSCRWDESGNYLIRDFEVQMADQKPLTGTQRIGYDPVTGHLKSWVFDAGGGFSEGYFQRVNNSWVLRAAGTTAEGTMAAGTNVFTRVDDHRMLWGAVDRMVGGEQVPDIHTVTIVKKPPPPRTMP